MITKGDKEDHNALVEVVINRLESEGWALKFSRCEFSVNQLTWLGYEIKEKSFRNFLISIIS